MNHCMNYHIVEKTSNEAFQALWIEISIAKNKNIICGIIYRQHNSPDRFQLYFDQSIENFTSFGKCVIILGDFNIDILKCETSSYSLFYLNSLQSCFQALIPSIDKPAQVRSSSATLKIIFLLILEPDNIMACGNIISDISDHFSQFCILKSAWDKTKTRNL